MNTKNIIIVAILGILLIGLVIFLFVGDANNTTVLTVGDAKYDISDFESYVKVFNYEEDPYKDSVDDMYKNYQSYKVYSTRAEKAGVVLSGDELPAQPESGDVEKLLNDYNLTVDEYMRVKTEMAKANKLYASPYELAGISPDYFTQYKESLLSSNPDAYTTYSYRVVEIQKDPEIEVEDESGDVVSGEVSGETSGEKEARRKAECKEKTDKVYELVKNYISASGDEAKKTQINSLKEILPEKEESVGTSYENIFEYIGSNTDNQRYTQNTSGFNSLPNGGLETASKIYMAEDMLGSNSYLGMFGLTEFATQIVTEVGKLKEGEVSEIFETPDGYAFVYMEKIADELTPEDETRFNNEIANYYLGQNANMTFNKVLIKQVDLEKLMPKVARDAEEARKQAELEANSGETIVSDGATIPEETTTISGEENSVE